MIKKILPVLLVLILIICIVILTQSIGGTKSVNLSQKEFDKRETYFNTVKTHYFGHNFWRNSELIKSHFLHTGGSHWSGSFDKGIYTGKGYQQLCFNKENEIIKREVLKVLPKIFFDMNVFNDPVDLVFENNISILLSQEGWYIWKARWIKEEDKEYGINEHTRALKIDYKFMFYPTLKSNEKQDLKRLNWVEWSLPLEDE